MPEPIEIFRAGTHRDMHGREYTVTAADLADVAAGYDPARHEAPLVKGHPQHDDPAMGWVERVVANGDSLEIVPREVAAGFADEVAAGRYKKISPMLWTPTMRGNPTPGKWALRHVGFLGAAVPSVLGMRPPAFAAELPEGVGFEMAAPQSGAWQALTRIASVLADYLPGRADATPPETPAPFAAPEIHTPEEPMSEPDNAEALRQRETDIAAREAQIQQREAAFAAQQTEQRNAATAARLDALVEQGRVLPAERAGLAAFFAGLDDTPAAFAAGQPEQAPTDYLLDLLGRIPARVDYSERTPPEQAEGQPAAFAAPDGMDVDGDRAALHAQALAYQQKTNCDYITAYKAVGGR